ncbi:MAG: sigma 54-interacting transcriptional regulator [Terracidiphilus sp.]|nr:sigma 54-interacting transcriptional regulator [Terracidiphilus sp.]
MHSAAQFSSHISLDSPRLLESESATAPVVGVNAVWRKLLLQAEMVAPHLQIAAIEGEQGSGKHTLARYIHERSILNRGPFQRRDAREWLVNEADPSQIFGFIYLDRVDLLGASGQGLLLSVLKALQDRSMGRTLLAVSSHAPIRLMASQGLFIPDLAFRLTAVRFAVPPLRQRKEDIAALSQVLLERICERYHQRPVILGPGALARLLQHSWPGNVRELASVLEAALFEAENGMIRAEDLLIPSYVERRAESRSSVQVENLQLEAMIHRHVQYVLDLNHGNKLRTARQLGISRSTLYRILGNEVAHSH